ncbi:DUF6053 domain-containing protein [Lysobacter enzymogenes]|uniref:DUF6053 domain-containing protein n=1 Tax=Lysobacter enzymogenes TaxID=69 RepID=UPI003CCDF7B0
MPVCAQARTGASISAAAAIHFIVASPCSVDFAAYSCRTGDARRPAGRNPARQAAGDGGISLVDYPSRSGVVVTTKNADAAAEGGASRLRGTDRAGTRFSLYSFVRPQGQAIATRGFRPALVGRPSGPRRCGQSAAIWNKSIGPEGPRTS